MYMPEDSLWWDGKKLDIDTNGNGPALLALSTLETLNVDDEFMPNLKGTYSPCAYFSTNNNERRLRQKIE
jgi:hypothetical protein